MKTAISLPDELFARIDRTAAEAGMTRSGFLAAAAESYLNDWDKRDLTARIDKVLLNLTARDEAVTEFNRARLETPDW